MVLRNLDGRLKTCLDDLIKYVKYESIYANKKSNLDLLSDPQSFLNQAMTIRLDLKSLAEPDKVEAIMALDIVFREAIDRVNEKYAYNLRERILYEISKLRKFLRIDKTMKNLSGNGQRVISR